MFGQETGVLYLWERSSGSVWKTFGDDVTQLKYNGEIKNGKPEGMGVLLYPSGTKYIGDWKDGRWNGQGTYTHSDGRKYVGEYKDGKPLNGTGYDKNGNIQVKFVNGKMIDP